MSNKDIDSAPIELAAENERLRQRITELETRNSVLEDLAATDELTGMLNRRAFDTRLKEEVARCARYGRAASLLYIDLDGLKAINDRHGHAEGDAILKRVAETMRKILRQTDIIARHGGDEFAVILPDTDLQGAAIAAERIRRSIGETHVQDCHVTASIGAAAYSPEVSSAEQLLLAADAQLYRAKVQGRNWV